MKKLSVLLLVAFAKAALVEDTPNLRGLQVPQAEIVGNNGDFVVFPLLACMGDCDEDDDCADGLTCFQRDDDEDVPGCVGGEDEVDYCVTSSSALLPLTEMAIQIIYVNGNGPTGTNSSSTGSGESVASNTTVGPLQTLQTVNENLVESDALSSPPNFGLGRCEGICESDNDCQVGLMCYKRNVGEDVPFCTFDDMSIKESDTLLDFCTLPPTPMPTSVPTSLEPTGVPTSPRPTRPPGILLAKFVGNPAPEPLARCEGDCDDDEDCAGDLICYDRDDNDPVPGCYFDGDEGMDIDEGHDLCIAKQYTKAPTDGPTKTPTMMPTPRPTPRPTPAPTRAPHVILATFVGNPPPRLLDRCEGDCDEDEDCAGDLVCFQRDDDDPAPGCYFDEDLGGMEQDDEHDICIAKQYTDSPTQSPTRHPTPAPTPWPTPSNERPEPVLARFVGNPADRDLFRCEGDCDSDSDCDGDLICHDRDDGDEAPGCYFSAEAGMDIEDESDVCIDRRSLGNQVRLRLYWERGYRWQEDRSEQYWCMNVQSSSVTTVRRCSRSSSRQRFEMLYQPGGSALIRSVSRDRCMTGGGSPDYDRCDPNNPRQHWIPMNGRWDTKFELTRYGNERDCLTNHHHPRSGETIQMRGCRREREYTTSEWTFY